MANELRDRYVTAQFEVLPWEADRLREQRASLGLNPTVNTCILMLLTMTVEGALEMLLRSQIWKSSGCTQTEMKSDTLLDRLYKKADTDIMRISGWNGYKNGFELIFGKTMADQINAPELMEAMATLFSFRGAVFAHGRSFNYYSKADPIFETQWESANHDRLDKYCEKLGFTNGWFSNELIDHFFYSAIAFLVELDISLPTAANLLGYTYNKNDAKNPKVEHPYLIGIIDGVIGDRANPYS